MYGKGCAKFPMVENVFGVIAALNVTLNLLM
jgi:hypothetical protein